MIASCATQAKADGVVATSKILVMPRSASEAAGPKTTGILDGYMTAQMHVLKSEMIAERANHSPELKSMPGFGNAEGTKLILASVSIESEKGDSVFNLSARGVAPEVGVTILKAVIRAYQEFLDETYKTSSEKVLREINDARLQLEEKVRRAETAYLDFSSEVNELGLGGEKTAESGFAIRAERLSKLELQKVELAARIEYLTVASKDDAAKDALKIRTTEWAVRHGLGKEDVNPERYISFLRLELGEVEALERAVQLDVKAADKKLHVAHKATLQINSLKEDLIRAKEQFSATVRRVDQMESLGRDRPGFTVSVISRPAAVAPAK